MCASHHGFSLVGKPWSSLFLPWVARDRRLAAPVAARRPPAPACDAASFACRLVRSNESVRLVVPDCGPEPRGRVWGFGRRGRRIGRAAEDLAAIGASAAAATALASASALGSLLGTKPFCFPFYRGHHVSMSMESSREIKVVITRKPHLNVD
eukprot:scaffold8325_cov57-Phaeocystis_antarctica.AAC.3